MNQPHQPQQPRPRIDPNQIPSPVAVQETDQNNYNAQAFMSMAKGVPPLALTEYTAVDEGNAIPRFIRATTYNIPLNDETAGSSNLPMGLVIQPLADLGPKEQPILVVDFGPEGPVRCQRCRAYINPFVVFTEGGRKFACNLCAFETEVPSDYFCNLDMSGRRMDFEQRPELQHGTVEFVATKEFCNRTPETAAYVFVIDVSWNAVKSGMLAQCVSSLREFLYSGRPRRTTTGVALPAGLESGCKIGFITFDSTVHFYNLKASLEQPQMLVIGDTNDVFVPIHEGFLVDPIESKPAIDSLLDMLPKMFENTTSNQPVLGAAVQAAYLALKARGGKMSVFQTVLPFVGPGALKNREDVKLLGTDKEKTLYEPQEYFWKKLAQDCSENGVCVDLYVFPNAYVDVATIGVLSSLTGGDIYHYLNFDVQRDGIKFGNDLIKTLSRNFGYDRLKITEHIGNFYMKNATDVELAGIDSHKSLAITVKHEGKLDERTDAYFQCALLYTTASGQRRIRVINLAVTPTQSLGNVFRYADMDTTITYLCKLAVNSTITTSLANVREQLTNRCVKILSSYRRHCATSTAPGQLILPESFKLYPMYSLSMLKSKAFRGGQEMSSDLRVYNFRMLKSMTARDTMMLMYPVLRPLHDLDLEPFTRDGIVKLPPAVRVSYERLDQSGAYVVDNGQQMFLWLGRQCNVDFLKMVFGVEGVEQIDAKLRVLPPLDNPYSAYVRAIIEHLQSQNSRYSNFQVVRHSLDAYIEVQFLNMMLEDKNNDNMNYVDYLCAVHRSIQLELSNN
ncbi:Sec23/Sec24 trunk domain-containing protein [Cladochytrium replicatum]|nr:Sec23/Sec24 trunk domain-containing protein [Cladochytrium replicatum]